MRIYRLYGVSNNETYCCTPKKLKSVLGDCDIAVAFEHGNRKFIYKNYKKIATDEIIIAEFRVSKNIIKPIFHIEIYSFSKSEFTEEIEKEFSEVVLPKMLSKYLEYSKGNENITNLHYNMTVLIKDGKLSVQEKIKQA